MKKFGFVFNNVTKILILLVSVLSLAGLVWNVYNVIWFCSESVIQIGKIIGFSIILLINLLLCIAVIFALIRTNYVVNDKTVTLRIGLIKSSIPIETIYSVIIFSKTQSLVIYYDEDKYSVINISKDKYNEFIDFIREKNPQITFSKKCEGEDTPI